MESLLFAVILFAAFLFIRHKFEKARKRDYWKQHNLADSNNQLKFVSRSRFYKRSLMNKSEFFVFRTLEKWIESRDYGERLFAQVPLGEILGADDSEAFHSINSKRCDFVVISRFGQPEVAIEYQGEGHFQGDAKNRDRVKAIALRSAGVPTVEVFPEDEPSEIIDNVENALQALHHSYEMQATQS